MFSAASKTSSQPAPAVNYIDDVFSTYLYAGNASTQTIPNGLDLSTKGGLVWLKERNLGSSGHVLFDTARSTGSGDPFLQSNTTGAQIAPTTNYLDYLSNGFTLLSGAGGINASGVNYVSWTFREQTKFFDVVTWTGDGTNNRAISHSLGSAPGMIILKCTSSAQSWICYQYRSLGVGKFIQLNQTSAATTLAIAYPSVTSTNFTPTADDSTLPLNTSGETYVAYLFAHDAGGFGAAGTDNVISCGSYTGTGAEQFITLGYEPQYVMIKQTSGSGGNWFLHDVMRGAYLTDSFYLRANSSQEESQGGVATIYPTATGFSVPSYSGWGASGETYIYMAIRRPMKPPTSGTQVFSPNKETSNGTQTLTTGFPVDLSMTNDPRGNPTYVFDRLRGSSSSSSKYLQTQSTAAEGTFGFGLGLDNNTGLFDNVQGASGTIFWNFRRATGFFDVVCYTGTGAATTFSHNLGVAPELMIVKQRNTTRDWAVYPNLNTNGLFLNSVSAFVTSTTYWNDTSPTSSVFTVGSNSRTNTSGGTYVAYLFATLAGISKVGTYTGNGSTQAISCGFTGGARFVLIKRTDDVGDWYVYDTARGMTLLTDPYLLLNSTAAESATLGSVTTTAGGFTVDATILAAINTNAASYIFLAIS